jgi:hypothetical protein
VLRHRRDGEGGADAADEGGRRRAPVRQPRADRGDRRARGAGRRGRGAGRRGPARRRAAGRAGDDRDVQLLPVEEPRRVRRRRRGHRPATTRSPSACGCSPSTARATRSRTS